MLVGCAIIMFILIKQHLKSPLLFLAGFWLEHTQDFYIAMMLFIVNPSVHLISIPQIDPISRKHHQLVLAPHILLLHTLPLLLHHANHLL
jgi:hypothetical protein